MQVAKPKKGYKLVKTSFGKYEEIPEEWEVSSFLDVVKLSGGTQPPRNSFSDSPKEGYVRLLQIRDFESDDLSCYVSKNNNLSFCSKKDILIARYGASLGKIVKGKEGAHNVALVRTIPNVMKIDNNFLFYWLNSTKCQNFIFRVGTRSAQDGFNKQDLKKLDIFLPILLEQQQIASILSNVDDTLQKTNQIIEQTQRLKKGMMQKLLTRGIGHTKFKKVKWYFGKELEIPEKWNLVPISEIVQNDKHAIVRGPFGGSLKKEIFQKKGFLVYEQFHAINDNFSMARYFIDEKKYKEMNRFSVNPGDLIISCSGVTLGKIAIIPENAKPGIINQALLKISFNPEIMHNQFFKFLFRSEMIQKRIFEISRGTGIPNLPSVKDLNKFILIPLLPLPEQKQIASILSNVDTQIQKEKLHKSNLERLKKGLMQKLLTGQIRVKVR